MYLSMSRGTRRRLSITRDTSCAWVTTAYGSNPSSPRRFRSARVKAMDL